MRYFAILVGSSEVRLWNLSTEQRIRRQLAQVDQFSLVSALSEVPDDAMVLALRADFLYEVRTLKSLVERPDTLLAHPDQDVVAAGLVSARHAESAVAVLRGVAAPPDQLTLIFPDQLGSFDHQLRKAKVPLLEPVSEQRRGELEALLYGSAYKGITDLITKFAWPRPARHAVRLCARLGITPNMVTGTGLLLMLWVCYLFANGQFVTGLAAGWLMTFLDTVDGKLARVTVRSSQFGHLLDHGMDLVHPPFWYWLWGVGLVAYQPIVGLDLPALYWLIVVGYIGGRLVEGLFHLLGDASIFSWRPFDAYFRLITARRNPCLILLTITVLIGRPDWGLVAVALWTAGTTGVLSLRLLQGLVVRIRNGPLDSWLANPTAAAARHPRAYHLFSGTRSAYAAG